MGDYLNDIKCPKCGSFEVAHHEDEDPEYYRPYCTDCGYDWPPEDQETGQANLPPLSRARGDLLQQHFHVLPVVLTP